MEEFRNVASKNFRAFLSGGNHIGFRCVGAGRPEQATQTALLVFSPPAAQAKTLSTPRVRALARAPIQPPPEQISSAPKLAHIGSKGEYLGPVFTWGRSEEAQPKWLGFAFGKVPSD
jgi:hypothetical protein